MGSRPLRPSVSAPRDTTDAAAGAGSPGSGPALNSGSGSNASSAAQEPVPFSWASPADLPQTVTALPRQAPAADAVPLQRLADPSAGASPATSAATHASAPMREITFPAAAGLPAFPGADPYGGPGLPGPSVLGGAPIGPTAPASVQRAASPAARSASAARRDTVADAHQASGPLALARPHLAGAAAATQAASGGTGHAAGTTSRITAATPSPVVQALSASASSTAGTTTTLPTFTATPVVQRVEGAAPPGGDDASGHSDKELDELAKAIFGRISNRLRTEVIHEREAKGLTFDAF